jgi:hypothetical protein
VSTLDQNDKRQLEDQVLDRAGSDVNLARELGAAVLPSTSELRPRRRRQSHPRDPSAEPAEVPQLVFGSAEDFLHEQLPPLTSGTSMTGAPSAERSAPQELLRQIRTRVTWNCRRHRKDQFRHVAAATRLTYLRRRADGS